VELNLDYGMTIDTAPNYPINAGDHLEELANLLAAGYLRLRLRQATINRSNFSRLENFPLDFSADQSAHVESCSGGDSQ
jgi:hypothetical protein